VNRSCRSRDSTPSASPAPVCEAATIGVWFMGTTVGTARSAGVPTSGDP
jgi:hypothetical protein